MFGLIDASTFSPCFMRVLEERTSLQGFAELEPHLENEPLQTISLVMRRS